LDYWNRNFLGKYSKDLLEIDIFKMYPVLKQLDLGRLHLLACILKKVLFLPPRFLEEKPPNYHAKDLFYVLLCASEHEFEG